ncbi:hypothetical protein EHM69_07950 [candidate division KSB1 bacterium]|nr:MAG: hypothetical protein EHM69_07950 [candidate division KSB1 bacterium]
MSVISYTKQIPVLFWILLFAAVLRFYGLGSESLWLDEGGTVEFSNRPFRALAVDWTQGPLFLALIKCVRLIAGTTEFTLRLLPAVFGILCVYAIYQLGRLLFGATCGLLAALFLAINPFAIFYSQDARPYTLFLWAAISAVYFVVRLAQNFRRRDAIGFAAFTVLALYTHPFAVFLIPVLVAAFGIFWLRLNPQNRKRALRLFLYSCGAAALLFCPQILRFAALFLRKADSNTVATWISVPTLDSLRQLFIQFFMQRYVSYFFVLTGIAALLFRKGISRNDRAGWMVVSALLLFSVLMPWIISIGITPIFVNRYLIPGLAAAVLLLAWSASVFPYKIRIPLVFFIIGLTAWPLYGYYTGADKDPWRETAQILCETIKAADLIVVYPSYISHPLEFYLPAKEIQKRDGAITSAFPPPIPESCRRIWLVQAYGPESNFHVREIERTISARFTADTLIAVRDRIKCNPFAYHVAQITLKRFMRTSNEE